MLRAKALLAAQCSATCKCPEPQHEHWCRVSPLFPSPHGVTVFHVPATGMFWCHLTAAVYSWLYYHSLKEVSVQVTSKRAVKKGGVSPKEKLQLAAGWLLFVQKEIIFTQAGSTIHCCPSTFCGPAIYRAFEKDYQF